MATSVTFSSRPLHNSIGRAAGLVPSGLQTRGVTSYWRLGPSLLPILVHEPAHAGGTSYLCKQTTSLRIQVGLGLLSVDAVPSAGGAQISCCSWKPRLIAAGCQWTSSTAASASEYPEVLVSEESGDTGDGLFGETRGTGQGLLQERVCERTMSLEDVASLYDYPLDEFQPVSRYLD